MPQAASDYQIVRSMIVLRDAAVRDGYCIIAAMAAASVKAAIDRNGPAIYAEARARQTVIDWPGKPQ